MRWADRPRVPIVWLWRILLVLLIPAWAWTIARGVEWQSWLLLIAATILTVDGLKRRRER